MAKNFEDEFDKVIVIKYSDIFEKEKKIEYYRRLSPKNSLGLKAPTDEEFRDFISAQREREENDKKL